VYLTLKILLVYERSKIGRIDQGLNRVWLEPYPSLGDRGELDDDCGKEEKRTNKKDYKVT